MSPDIDDSTEPLLPSAQRQPRAVKPRAAQVLLNLRALAPWLLLSALLGLGALTFTGKLPCKGKSTASRSWPTSIGYAGPTPTGSEAFAAATSYPSYHDTFPLKPPSALTPGPKTSFNVLHHLGNLAPWRTVSHGLAATAEIPKGCTIEEIHLLHRHGARYPTTGAGPAKLAKKLKHAKGFRGLKDLAFLNDWSYQLGAEILTPFGREQLFSLGAGFRVKYGRLLNPSTDSATRTLPVFRTESQDRMLKSALNFAAGFFGIPYEDQYHQLITIEAPGLNNTLSPYMTCTNAGREDLNLAHTKVPEWIGIYLADALVRLQAQVEGLDLELRDVYHMQEMCAYELVALGGSAFCDLFTEEEWEGFRYSHDLGFWYGNSFGQPAQAAVGLGWVEEWLARVTKTPVVEHRSTTNASYHTPQYFPLDQRIYVDATHDTVISAIITALNFKSFAASGPPPSTHVPANHSFDTSKISPFAANLQSQILSCPSRSASTVAVEPTTYVRWILNDGVVPLEDIGACGKDADGLCELRTFVDATKEFTESIDWAYDCLAPYELGDVPIVDGRPASRPR